MAFLVGIILGYGVMSVSIILESKGHVLPWIPLIAILTGLVWGYVLGAGFIN